MKKYCTIAVGLLLFALALILNLKHVGDYPTAIHAWAQSDRYALANGFVDNNLNFFAPQTYIYNHQFPDKWVSASESRRTSVDFPINDYIPAVVMKVLGTDSPAIFRGFVLIISVIGLLFLYKTILLVNPERKFLSFFVVMLLALSPTYVYYQCNFLPTVPCISYTFIGIYFYVKYLLNAENKSFRLALFFLTIAALARFTFSIYLIAVFCLEIIRKLFFNNQFRNKIIPFVIAFGLIVIYFIYNSLLEAKYGSQFLSAVQFPKSIDEFLNVLRIVKEDWLFMYFTKVQYIVMVLFIMLLLIYAFRKKLQNNSITTSICIYAIIVLIGSSLVAFLMLMQFKSHDYYFLDLFFIPISLFLLWIVSVLPLLPKEKLLSLAAIVVCAMFFVKEGIVIQRIKYNMVYWGSDAVCKDFVDSGQLLSEIGVEDDAKMLSLTSFAPNLSFAYMNRPGYVVLDNSKEQIHKALRWDYDYIVIQNKLFPQEVYTMYPDIMRGLHRVGGNDKITVCKYADNGNVTLESLFGYCDSVPRYSYTVDYESVADKSFWRNFQHQQTDSITGDNFGFITEDIAFGLTYSVFDTTGWLQDGFRLFFSADFNSERSIDCGIITKIESSDSTIYYRDQEVTNYYDKFGDWQRVSMVFDVPEIEENVSRLTFYIWNKNKNAFKFDDFHIAIY